MNVTKKLVKYCVFFACLTGLSIYYFSTPSLKTMAGQMIMTGFHGDGSDENNEEFQEIENQIKNGYIGGVILFDVDMYNMLKQGMSIEEAKKQIFSSNIKNVNQVKQLNNKLQSLAPIPLFISIDQEGGTIQRLKPEHGFASIPSAKQLSKGDTKVTYEIAYDLGLRLSSLGFNVNFAPLLDVDINPNSPAIGFKERSFSSNPDIVIKHASSFAQGLEQANIAYSFKHFPGHGSATNDSHNGITDITHTYKIQEELKPWETLLKQSSPYAMVMVAHIINEKFDTMPASLSPKTIQMIRNIGFNGIIVSDDLDMGAITNEYDTETVISMAINAGNDILVFGNNLTFDKNRGTDVNKTIVNLVKQGKIKKSRIRESYNRIMTLKKHLRKNKNKHLRLEKNQL